MTEIIEGSQTVQPLLLSELSDGACLGGYLWELRQLLLKNQQN